MSDSKKTKPRTVRRTKNKNEETLRDMIARKAYEIYEERGREEGKDFEHWLEAETIINAVIKKAK